ncbi:MAG: dihydroorotase [Alphaproteobacteria bacterium]|nr:dihydroorotase [Alphaproteobacteria bacterium]
MTEILTIIRPDDFHAHFRTGDLLRAVVPLTAAIFGRAVAMPNLRPPVTTTARAKTYREEILAAVPHGVSFEPLMTLYLTDLTDANDLQRGFEEKILSAAKLYPANATTNSEFGISNIKRIYPVLERMQKIGMPVLMHGEVADAVVDIFDREAVFIERVLVPLRRDFPALKIVMEHITTEEAVDYVREEGGKGTLAATVTAHHLHINRNALLAGGVRPHYYCLPIAKREKHRQALIKAATSGEKMFFLGTDSAPHALSAKESSCGCAGCFTSVTAFELYAQIFDEAGKLDKLEAFASINGARFYGLPINQGSAILRKITPRHIKPILTQDAQTIMPFEPPSPLLWEASVSV